jgi:hypothetical protein
MGGDAPTGSTAQTVTNKSRSIIAPAQLSFTVGNHVKTDTAAYAESPVFTRG